MLKKLLRWQWTAFLCSTLFTSIGMIEPPFLDKNELLYSEERIKLNFGGLEELPCESQCFHTDLYLSDVDLNNSSSSNEKVLLVLRNHMAAQSFVNGQFAISNDKPTSHSFIKAEILNLNGHKTDLKVSSGMVEYEGEYPQIDLIFDLKLTNGEVLRGSFDKQIQSFKYYF